MRKIALRFAHWFIDRFDDPDIITGDYGALIADVSPLEAPFYSRCKKAASEPRG